MATCSTWPDCPGHGRYCWNSCPADKEGKVEAAFFTCSTCGTETEVENGDGLMAEAEEMFAADVLGGRRGPACAECRADFLAWVQEEGSSGLRENRGQDTPPGPPFR